MGNNNSHPTDPNEKKASDEIDHNIYKSRQVDAETIKLLLLGAGESGKSTLFKQMVHLYGNGFDEKAKTLYIPMVYNNTITAMNELVKQSKILNGCALTDSTSIAYGEQLASVDCETITADTLTPELGAAIKHLWADPMIREVYRRRAEFQLVDSVNEYFDDIERISANDYLPTHDDVIKCRVRTTGIVENKFRIQQNQFLMVDVGGQRNERKKWIHCFEGVTAVIFVAAMSAYDQTLYEDGKTNRLDEALALFQDTHQSQWFQRTHFILFLNKRDLFETKIVDTPLSVWGPAANLENANDYHSALEFIKQKFHEGYDDEKRLYVHVTCATDSNNVEAVFGAVKDIIIQKHLCESGLI